MTDINSKYLQKLPNFDCQPPRCSPAKNSMLYVIAVAFTSWGGTNIWDVSNHSKSVLSKAHFNSVINKKLLGKILNLIPISSHFSLKYLAVIVYSPKCN